MFQQELELATFRNALEEIDTLIRNMGALDVVRVINEIHAIVKVTLDSADA